MTENKKLRVFIITYTVVIVLFIGGVWFPLSGMTYYPPVGTFKAKDSMLAQFGILNFIHKISLILCLLLFLSLGITVLLLVIGVFGINRKWGRYVCLTGIWLFIIYLFAYTIQIALEFLLPVKLWYWDWLLWDAIPQLLIAWISTIWIFLKVRKPGIRA